MALDLVAARAVARAKLLERALHDRGPWEIEVNGIRAETVKLVTLRQVIFMAYFPPLCWMDPPEVAWLVCRGEQLSSQDIMAPGDGPHMIQWVIDIEMDSDLVQA